jgi:hypothetical protein
MKFFISTILIALVSFVACLYLPWWFIAIVGFIVAFAIPQKAGVAFVSGFIALFILWAGLSFYVSNANDHLLAHKISMLLLMIVTGVIGGLVAGFGSLTGRLCKKLFVAQ